MENDLKSLRNVVLALFVSGSGIVARGQGTFQNLDFESATIVTDTPPNLILTAPAFPSWSVSNGTNQSSIILYNDHYSFVSLWGMGNALGGNFSAGLNSVGVTGGGAISQTGLVPADTKTLLFKGSPVPLTVARSLSVSLAGQYLNYARISSGPNYVLWGADISTYAGQTIPLTFRGFGLLDDIQFSPLPIPEPGAASLVAVGIILMVSCQAGLTTRYSDLRGLGR